MNVLLSIKPKYAELIKSGIKKYEFRRKVFKKAGGCKVFIYSTSPVKKITGVFDASLIHPNSPRRIWDMFGPYSGISEGEFFRYFKDCEIAYAIEIRNLVVFKKPRDPSDYFFEFNPPQSYRYFNPHQRPLPFLKNSELPTHKSMCHP
jgi:predicted transcriptional regulator